MIFRYIKSIVFILLWIIAKVVEHYLDWFNLLMVAVFFILIGLLVFEILRTAMEWQSVNWAGKYVERKKGSFRPVIRFINISVLLVLLYLTCNPSTTRVIDKMTEEKDWQYFYNKRTEIVKQVDARLLSPDKYKLHGLCQLPSNYPPVSHGGNQIYISKYPDKDEITVCFFIYRGFFEGYDSYFIYTNHKEHMEELEELIVKKPGMNWKVEENWYRIVSRDLPPYSE